MSVDVAVLERDARAIRSFGNEPHLDLARVGVVRFELPRRPDVPAEHDASRGLVRQYPRPPAFAAVGSAVVDVPAHARLEHRLDVRLSEEVVLRRLESAE